MVGRRLRQLALAAAALSLGCMNSDGGDTPTDQLTPDFRVIANPSTTTVFARLGNEDLLSIRLPDGDELRVASGTQEKALGYAVDPVNGAYYTGLLVAPALDEPVVFSLNREGEADAPNSRVTMPASMRISAPAADTLVLAGSDLIISWEPSGTADDISIVLSTTSCTGGGSTAPRGWAVDGDPGTATITVPVALLPPNLPFGGSCDVSLRLERTRSGTPDPAFASGGSVIARQIDFRNIFVTPE